jgi:hypothetical protein
MVVKFEQINITPRPFPGSTSRSWRMKGMSGWIECTMVASGNRQQAVCTGKQALLIVRRGIVRHYKRNVASGRIVGNQMTLRFKPPPSPVLTGVIGGGGQGGLVVSPSSGFTAQGPHSEDRFKPRAKHYTLTNCENRAITYRLSNRAKWLRLSRTSGNLAPGGSAKVTLSLKGNLKKLDDADYHDQVLFQNLTTGRGNAVRPVVLRVLTHKWQVFLAGHEIDLKNKHWRQTGGRRIDLKFLYNLSGRFEIGQKRGRWIYRRGTITATHLSLLPVFVPASWWEHKPPVCGFKCQTVKALPGQKLKGFINAIGGGKAYLIKFQWGRFEPQASMWSRLKPSVTCTPMPKCKKDIIFQGATVTYDSYYFYDQITHPWLALQNGHASFQKKAGHGQDSAWVRFNYNLKRLK